LLWHHWTEGPYHKQLWDNATSLFYRDGSYVGKGVFWGRANGWAITALANGLRFAKDPKHIAVYTTIFKQLSAELASIQGLDGAWRASLLNASGFPTPETTGTANFVYGLAWGINAKVLDVATYLPVVEKGWEWLQTVAFQPNGQVGNCQPVGASPAVITSAMTSDFCVGQFLLAASEVSKLAKVFHNE
jgi:rhamnogalacturonyl hydrolase YesR